MAAAEDRAGEHLVVARVRRPHGIRGDLHIAVDTDRPREVFRKGRVLHIGDQRARATGRSVTVIALRTTPGGGILKVEGLADREGADALRGATLLIDGVDAAPAAADEVHYRDLVGLTAFAGDARIGQVEDILEYPAGETLLVRGAEGQEILIPYVKGLVRGVDLEQGVLALELPEGYLEL